MSTLAAASAASACAAAAAAQQADEGLDTLAEVVVTAQMRSQNVQDIPLAITAISGDLLESRSQTSLKDIAAQAPNVVLQQNPSGNGNSMRAFIRGVGQSDQSPSMEPGVGIYIDDIYFGTITASAFDLLDLDRVEILRGPQGTLAGMNSQGGSVKLYSRRPEGEGGYVEATVGSLGRRDFKASADFTVVPDTMFARITGVVRNRDGHVKLYNYACLNPGDPDIGPQETEAGTLPGIPALTTSGNCRSGELGNQKMYALRAALRIAPSGSPLEINLVGDYTNDTSSTQASVLLRGGVGGLENLSNGWQGVAYDNRFVPYGEFRPANAVLNDPYASYANFYDPGVTRKATDAAGTPGETNGPYIAANAAGTEAWGVSATIDYQLNDELALKSISGYRTYDTLSGNDNDNSPVVMIQSTDWFSYEAFSQELRLTGDLVGDAVHFTVGGIYFDSKTRPLSRIHTPFSGITFSFLNDDIADLQVKAGFANVGWDVTEAVTLEAGIRYTDESKDYTFGRLNPDGVGDYLPLSNPANPLTGWTGSYHDKLADYRLAASWNITADAMVYAQYATGHKAGGITPRPYNYQQIRPFGAEKLNSAEVGFKVDVLGRRVRLNGALFRMDYKDYQGMPTFCVKADGSPLGPQLQIPGSIDYFCGQIANLADAKVKGYELEALVRPVAGLSIDASLSSVDFKFGEPKVQTGSVVAGQSRPGIGKLKWSAGVSYGFKLGDLGTLTPRVDVSSTPGYCGTFLCEEISKVERYTLANARLTFETADRDWSVALEGTNITDKLYYLNKFVIGNFYATAQPGRPAEYALTVRRRF